MQRVHTVTYDGFGTLKTEKGSYSNIFRMAIHDRDSNYIIKSITNDYKAFWWMKQGGAVPLFQAYQQASAGTVYNTYVASGSGTSDVIGDKQNNEVRFFPNPAHDVITTSGITAEKIFLHNAIGITVRTYDISLGNSLELRGLPNGIYFIRIGSVTKKIIKE